jgi:nondiscriminating glutamyl-tRNA synthetase
VFAHLSVIVGEDRKKLSKRQASVSVKDFREQGFLPEAMLNFLLLLGWSHPDGRDICSIDEMIKQFDLSRVHSSSAYFDVVRLRWMNAQYLRAKSVEEVKGLLERFTGTPCTMPESIFEGFWALYASDCETLKDVQDRYLGLTTWVEPDKIPTELKDYPLSAIWQAWRDCLASHPTDWLEHSDIKAYVKQCLERAQAKGQALFWSLRFAVIGSCEGADLSQMAGLLSRNELIKRVESSLALLKL